MNYRRLGRSGLRVSELCLGTMTFGSRFFNIATVDQAAANRMVARAVEAGINFFDTADVYSMGESEQTFGQALKSCGVPRESAVVATKVFAPMSEAAANGEGDVNNAGLSRHHIMAACEASLRRLGTGYIDLSRFTPGTSWHRSKKRCVPSTTWCGRGRCATWDAQTGPRVT